MSKVALIDADSIIYFSLSSKKDEPLKTSEEAKRYIDNFIKGIVGSIRFETNSICVSIIIY